MPNEQGRITRSNPAASNSIGANIQAVPLGGPATAVIAPPTTTVQAQPGTTVTAAATTQTRAPRRIITQSGGTPMAAAATVTQTAMAGASETVGTPATADSAAASATLTITTTAPIAVTSTPATMTTPATGTANTTPPANGTMTTANVGAGAIIRLPHRIIMKTEYPTFYGRVDGVEVSPTASEWIKKLEERFISDGLTEDATKIAEAKQAISKTKGNAIDMIEGIMLDNWEDWKEMVLKFYARGPEGQQPSSLELMQSLWKKGEEYGIFLGRIFNACRMLIAERGSAAGETSPIYLADRVLHRTLPRYGMDDIQKLPECKTMKELYDKGAKIYSRLHVRGQLLQGEEAAETAKTINYIRNTAGYKTGEVRSNSEEYMQQGKTLQRNRNYNGITDHGQENQPAYKYGETGRLLGGYMEDTVYGQNERQENRKWINNTQPNKPRERYGKDERDYRKERNGNIQHRYNGGFTEDNSNGRYNRAESAQYFRGNNEGDREQRGMVLYNRGSVEQPQGPRLRCYNCNGFGHISDQCPSSCRLCGARNHCSVDCVYRRVSRGRGRGNPWRGGRGHRGEGSRVQFVNSVQGDNSVFDTGAWEQNGQFDDTGYGASDF